MLLYIHGVTELLYHDYIIYQLKCGPKNSDQVQDEFVFSKIHHCVTLYEGRHVSL